MVQLLVHVKKHFKIFVALENAEAKQNVEDILNPKMLFKLQKK